MGKYGISGQVSQDIVSKSNMTPLDGDIDIIDDISITFRLGDLHPFSNETSLNLTGFLVYTGEPHFVIFPETGFSINELSKVLFVSSHPETPASEPHERRIMFGSWLINHIGMHLNKRYTHIFPNGINVNFVDIPTGNMFWSIDASKGASTRKRWPAEPVHWQCHLLPDA